jgi:hypothetical protein
MAQREDRITIRFNGNLYQKYSDRPYFERVGGRYLLHRDVWEFHNGPIPKGFHVHHIDGDTSNNSIENLEMLEANAHRELHKPEVSARSQTEEHLAHLDAIRPLAAEWHGSEEGKEWHKGHAKNSIHKPGVAKPYSKIVPQEKTCNVCKKIFLSKNPKRQHTCSQRCHSIRHNQQRTVERHENAKERNCPHCGQAFKSVYTCQKFCCTKCKQDYANTTRALARKAGLQPNG